MIQILRLSAFGVALALVSALGDPDVVFAQSAPSAAPQVVRVGDPSVDGAFLKPYKNAWKVVYEFPGKEPFLVGIWSMYRKNKNPFRKEKRTEGNMLGLMSVFFQG